MPRKRQRTCVFVGYYKASKLILTPGLGTLPQNNWCTMHKEDQWP